MNLLVAYFLGIFTAFKADKRHLRGKAYTHAGYSAAQGPISLLCTPPTLSDEERAEQEKRKRREIRLYRAQLLNLLVLSIYTGFTILIWCSTKDTLRAYKSKERAILTITPYVGADKTVVFTVKNIGHSSVTEGHTQFFFARGEDRPKDGSGKPSDDVLHDIPKRKPDTTRYPDTFFVGADGQTKSFRFEKDEEDLQRIWRAGDGTYFIYLVVSYPTGFGDTETTAPICVWWHGSRRVFQDCFDYTAVETLPASEQKKQNE